MGIVVRTAGPSSTAKTSLVSQSDWPSLRRLASFFNARAYSWRPKEPLVAKNESRAGRADGRGQDGRRPGALPAEGEVLVKLKCCGVCGTDLEKVQGVGITTKILGHEAVGEVEEVGKGVNGDLQRDARLRAPPRALPLVRDLQARQDHILRRVREAQPASLRPGGAVRRPKVQRRQGRGARASRRPRVRGGQLHRAALVLHPGPGDRAGERRAERRRSTGRGRSG